MMKSSLSKFSFLLATLLSMAPFKSHAFFCQCTPENYTDIHFYVAPQVARLKLTIDQFAIYRGVLAGGSAGFEYKPFCSTYFGAFAEWMMGDTSSVKSMNRYIHDFDSEVRLGYNFPMWNFYALTITPYIGFGFLQTIHHIRPDPVVSSLKFSYESYYFPWGGMFDFRVTKHFGFGFLIEKRQYIVQRLKTPYIDGIKFILKQNTGYLLEVPFILSFGSKYKGEVRLVPYLKREANGRLKAILPDAATLGMPKQEYKYWGLRLGLGMTF